MVNTHPVSLCIFWGYAGLLKNSVDYFLASKRRPRFSSIYLFTYEDINFIKSENSAYAENVQYVSIKDVYNLDQRIELGATKDSLAAMDLGCLDANFSHFNILCDRCSIIPTVSQVQRARFFRHMKKYFIRLLQSYQKVVIYFESYPHYPAECVLDICVKYHPNATTIYSHDTTLANYFFMTKNIESKVKPSSWIKCDDTSFRTNNVSLSDWLSDALRLVKTVVDSDNKNVNDASTGSLSRFAERLNSSSLILSSLTPQDYLQMFSPAINRIAYDAARNSNWNSGLLMCERPDENIVRDVYCQYIYKSFELLEYYNALCLSVSEIYKKARKACFVPLHYQPERSTFPDGGDYFDQIRFIEEIRSKLHLDYPIIVKEHPTQLVQKFPNPQCGMWRNKAFYDEIKNIGNTYFAPLNVNHHSLIYESRLIASVTGTSGWQALMLGKRCIYGGFPWYGGHANSFNINDLASIDELMQMHDISPTDGLCSAIAFFENIRPCLHRAGFIETENLEDMANAAVAWGEAIVSASIVL